MVKAVEAELRDRFGEPPNSVKYLLTLTDLKVMAAERGVTRIASEDDRLMLVRNGDFVQIGGKFPRLTSKTVLARLKEVRRLLMAL
jgi:transcription-repair coupling factor (superfamily II helicase)